MFNVPDGIREKASKDGGKGISRKPDAGSQGVLGRLVPDAGDQSETRTYSALEHTKENTKRSQ